MAPVEPTSMVSVPARNGAISVTDQGRASDRGDHVRSTDAKMHDDVLIIKVSGALHSVDPVFGKTMAMRNGQDPDYWIADDVDHVVRKHAQVYPPIAADSQLGHFR